MTTELAKAIAAGWAKADRNNLGPTVDYFYDLLQRFPDNQYGTSTVAPSTPPEGRLRPSPYMNELSQPDWTEILCVRD